MELINAFLKGMLVFVVLHGNRGYLIFSVKDRFLFHRMNTKSCIFMAASENTAFGVHE